MGRIIRSLILWLALAGCAQVNIISPTRNPSISNGTTPSFTLTPTPTFSPSATPSPVAAPCQPAPVTIPTRPAVIPRTNELDETTGLHMTGDVQQVDLPSYRLVVGGLVDHPLSLSYDELRCLPRITALTRIVCSTFSDSATFTGVPLAEILSLAGIREGAAQIELVGADGYTARVPMLEALKSENFLAYEWQGKPLPILHGFPVRALFPSLAGAFSVKWLIEIRVQ